MHFYRRKLPYATVGGKKKFYRLIFTKDCIKFKDFTPFYSRLSKKNIYRTDFYSLYRDTVTPMLNLIPVIVFRIEADDCL